MAVSPLIPTTMVLVATAAFLFMMGKSSAYITTLRKKETFVIPLHRQRPFCVSHGAGYSTSLNSFLASGVETRNRNKLGSERKRDDVDPSEDPQAYLEEPKPVSPRAGLTGTVLVSGWVRPDSKRSDQFVFDLLHSEDSAFRFSKIIALVDDIKYGRKRLLGRSARYTGLLDVLDFMETAGKQGTPLPTPEQLFDIKHWVANIDLSEENVEDAMTTLKKIAILCASAPNLENLSILISSAVGLDLTACHDIFSSYADKSYKYAVVAVGNLEDRPEGSIAYDVIGGNSTFCASMEEKTVIGSNDVLSRDESLRLVTECLQLESAANKVFGFAEVKSTNLTESAGARLVKGLREAGYSRPQEINYMISDGLKNYLDACESWNDRWEYADGDEGFSQFEEPEWQIQAMKEWEERGNVQLKSVKEGENLSEEEMKKRRQVEDFAMDWAKKEYRRRRGGTMIDSIVASPEDLNMTEDEFLESEWERALLEGDIRWRIENGLEVDARTELNSFEAREAKKREVMLRKAKEKLEEQLGDVDPNIREAIKNFDPTIKDGSYPRLEDEDLKKKKDDEDLSQFDVDDTL